jgi:hypothetical protein
MSHYAFWLSTCLLLLYHLRTDSTAGFQSATADAQDSLIDLINEIVVYIIRDVERRLDKILEKSMIDYEALPSFEDILFEGHWKSTRFIQKLTGSTSMGRKSAARPSILSSSSIDDELSPKTITNLLSSTLFILQLYEM